MLESRNFSSPHEKNAEYLLTHRESEDTHFPAEVLKLIVCCVMNGDSESIRELRRNYMSDVRDERTTDSILKRTKYGAIAIAGSVAGHIDESTVTYEHAALMIDIFILKIDSLNSVLEVYDSMFDIFIGLAIMASGNTTKAETLSSSVKKAQNYINRNLHSKIYLADIAEECGLSASYLSALFKKETGENISDYIMREKMREAEYMLIIGKYKISEICYFLNFCSQSYFTHYFKKQHGVTPAQYRKRVL